jgi:hypothetical protein
MVRDPSPARLTTEQQMTVDLARLALERVAPHEMPVFDLEVAAYLAGPRKRVRRRERPLGAGLDFSLLAPYALAVAGWAAGFVLKVAEDELADRIRATLARAAGRPREPEPERAAVVALDAERVEQLRATLLRRATEEGLAEARAQQLVDAVINELRDRPER